MDVKFNLNDQMTVELTDLGRARLLEYNEMMLRHFPGMRSRFAGDETHLTDQVWAVFQFLKWRFATGAELPGSCNVVLHDCQPLAPDPRLHELATWLESRGVPADYPLEPGQDAPWGWVVFVSRGCRWVVAGKIVSPEGEMSERAQPAWDLAKATFSDERSISVDRWDRATPEQRAEALRLGEPLTLGAK